MSPRAPAALASLSVLAGAVLASPATALACSAFLRDGPTGPLVGKSYDWSHDRGMAVVNPRGLAKRAFVVAPRDVPAAWTSRLGSLTFNQYGRELPNGGMNEAGLVVEVLILQESRPEPPDGRPVVTELGLVQYLLDQAESTDQAISLARKVRVVQAYAPLHYFVCDAARACATLELLDGRLVVTRGERLRVRAVTNSRYAASLRSLGQERTARPDSSLGRFARVAGQIGAPAGDAPVAAALAVLDSVRLPDRTQWSVVYEPAARRVHFRTRSHPSLKTVALSAFALGCEPGSDRPVMTFDLASDAAGDVSAAFRPYRAADNRALVEASLAPLRGALPPGTAARVAEHPGTAVCAR